MTAGIYYISSDIKKTGRNINCHSRENCLRRVVPALGAENHSRCLQEFFQRRFDRRLENFRASPERDGARRRRQWCNGWELWEGVSRGRRQVWIELECFSAGEVVCFSRRGVIRRPTRSQPRIGYESFDLYRWLASPGPASTPSAPAVRYSFAYKSPLPHSLQGPA